MKKTKQPGKFKRFCKGVLAFLGEIFGELIIYVIAFAIGLGLVLLFGIDFKDLDPESIVIGITLIGFLVISVIVIAGYWLVKARSNKKANKDKKSNMLVSADENTNP